MYGNFIIIGMGLGPKAILGTIVGLIISGTQLSIGSGMSGIIWSAART